MLVCRSCFNTKKFAQVSDRADARDVEQTANGVKISAWNRPDERVPGLYCPECGSVVEPDPDIDVVDGRRSFVRPGDFDSASFVDELLNLRSDGTKWTRLDLPPQAARYAESPRGLAPALESALDRAGRLPGLGHT